MAARDDLIAILESGDIAGLKRAWSLLAPHLPQPRGDAQVEIMLHVARTETRAVSFRARAWSHRWLTERMFPSKLPDNLRPAAERLYPQIVAGVGIAMKATSPLLRPVLLQTRKAMEDAVLEAEADGKLGDGVHVRQRMAEAKERTIRALLH